MGSYEFDELMRLRNECAAAREREAALESKLRNVVHFGTRGNCPPARGCGRSAGRNCEACWLEWLGLACMPQAVEREGF